MSTPPSDGDRALPRKRGRSVPAIYGIVSLVLVVGAVTFALSTPPPSTPPLAAVAPAPQEQLEVERVEQSSRFGEGTGGVGDCVPGDLGCAGVGESPPTPPPTDDQGVPAPGQPDEPEVIESPAAGELRHCANGPGGPRQTDDPQSPPCKREIFTGDNGGPTAPGVSATTIRIGLPRPLKGYFTSGDGNNTVDDIVVVRAFATHLERHYELYGRSIELVEIDKSTDSGPAADRAHAGEIAAHDVFAYISVEAGSATFLRALAERGVVAFSPGRSPTSHADVYSHSDLIHGLFPSTEQQLLATGDLVCSALADRPARHGGAEVADTTRVFGVIARRGTVVVDAAPLVQRLRGCGADHVVRDYDPASDDLSQALRALREAGVTTVVCACGINIVTLTDPAAEMGWEPEWLLPGSPGTSEFDQWKQVDVSQRGHVFGLTGDFRHLTDGSAAGPAQDSLRLEERFWFHVLREEAPAHAFPRINRAPAIKAHDLYSQLLVLGSGIQWAGPDLTPEAFTDALTGLAYPNPDVGAALWFQPAVGFGPADRTFNSDFALVWWSLPDNAATTDATGSACYVGDGRRFTAGSFPADADELFFDPDAGCT